MCLFSYSENSITSLKTHYLLIAQQTALTLDTIYLVYYNINSYEIITTRPWGQKPADLFGPREPDQHASLDLQRIGSHPSSFFSLLGTRARSRGGWADGWDGDRREWGEGKIPQCLNPFTSTLESENQSAHTNPAPCDTSGMLKVSFFLLLHQFR